MSWSPQQAAAFLGVRPKTVRAMAHRGEIPAVKVGRLWRFDETTLREWVELIMQPPAPLPDAEQLRPFADRVLLGFSVAEPSAPVIRTIRYFRVKQATPRWVSHAELDAIYAEARRLSRIRKVPQHVDHIVPICGKDVSGLHVPWNLRIIPAVDNLAKSNRHVPEP